MPKTAPLARLEDIAESLALLTRLPVHARHTRGARSAWAWPLAGVVVAFIAAIAASTALAFGLPTTMAAGLALAVQIATTGALHEDGLADTADGLWGGMTPERRLEIMKDSHIGSYGVLALGVGVLLRWAALVALFDAGWIAAPLVATALLSRAPMAALAAALPNARGAGLAHHVGRPGAETATLAVALAVFGALLVTGWAALAAILWVSLASIALAAMAKAKIHGQTGDILGAAQQLGEITALAAFAATL